MSYDVVITLGTPLPAARVEAVVLHLPGVRANGKKQCWCHDAFAADGQRFFTIEVGEKSWLGRVKTLALNLPYGGSLEEARLFGAAVERLVVALEGRAFDPQWGRDLPIASEADAVVEKWREGNVWTLSGYASGWHVRPRTVVVEDGRTLLPEAVSADPTDPEARASVERALARMGPRPAPPPRPRTAAERAEWRGPALRLADIEADAASDDPGRLVAALVALASHDLDEEREDGPTEEDLIEALVALGAPAVEPLIRALEGPAGFVARDALTRLGAAAVPGLIAALARGDEGFGVEDALLELGPTARAPLAAALAGASATTSRAILELLGAPELEADLAAAEAAVDHAVRSRGAHLDVGEVLASAAARGDVGPLVARLLREGPAYGALEAVGAAARAGVAAAFEPLLEHLLAAEETDAAEVGELLAAIDRAGAARRLEAELDRPDRRERASRLLEALAVVDGARALPRLVARIRSDAEDDAAAEDAFEAAHLLAWRVRDPAALSHLLALLDDPLPDLRRAVAGALRAQPAVEARDALGRLAREDPDETVRQAAVDALKQDRA